MKNVADEFGKIIAQGETFHELAKQLHHYYTKGDAAVAVISQRGYMVVCDTPEEIAGYLETYYPGRETFLVGTHINYHFRS